MRHDDALAIAGALALRESIERALGQRARASDRLTDVHDPYLLALTGLRCVLARVAGAVEELDPGEQRRAEMDSLSGRLSR